MCGRVFSPRRTGCPSSLLRCYHEARSLPTPTSPTCVYEAFLLLITTEHCSFRRCLTMTRPNSRQEQRPLTKHRGRADPTSRRRRVCAQDSSPHGSGLLVCALFSFLIHLSVTWQSCNKSCCNRLAVIINATGKNCYMKAGKMMSQQPKHSMQALRK